ncbi:MAG: DUF3014 domain-containing protein [Luteitalea sp.]|nr:DUF3014 domain-containing protein [Luteitalea sp.]
MIELSNYELQKPPERPPASGMSRSLLVRVGAVVLLLVLIGAAYYLYKTRPWSRAETPPVETSAPVETLPPAPEPTSLGQPAEPVDVPPLTDSSALDALVRRLVGPLSSQPQLAALLTTDDLVRRFVVSIDNIARGVAPANQVRAVAPKGDFAVETSGQQMVVDPRSYDRYNGLATTVASLDADALARLYSTLKPRFDEAYRELGNPTGDFDVAIEQALVRMLDTPDVTGPMAVRQGKGVNYIFADENIEALPSAQKQLIRMGPRNRTMVEQKLRELARALGIPADRLPPITS